MANQKLTQLTAMTDPARTDIMYVGKTPGGSPLSRKMELEYLLRMNTDPLGLYLSLPFLKGFYHGLQIQGAGITKAMDFASDHHLSANGANVATGWNQFSGLFPIPLVILTGAASWLSYPTATDFGMQNWAGLTGWFYCPSTAGVMPLVTLGGATISWMVYSNANVLYAVVYNGAGTPYYANGGNIIPGGWNFISWNFGWASAGNYENRAYLNGVWGSNSADPGGVARAPVGAVNVLSDGTNHSNGFGYSTLALHYFNDASGIQAVQKIWEATRAFYGR